MTTTYASTLEKTSGNSTSENNTSVVRSEAVEAAYNTFNAFYPYMDSNKKAQYFSKIEKGTAFISSDASMTYSFISGEEEANQAWAIRESFVGLNEKLKFKERSMVKYDSNFIYGSDTTKHKKQVKGYQELTVDDLYDGTNLILKTQDGSVEKIFEVLPGANIKDIVIKVEGGNGALSVDNEGNLIVDTDYGPIEFTKPIAWQDSPENEVDIAYRVDGNQYGFAVGEYDKSKPMYIDPQVVSTYFGQQSDNNIADVAVSDDGYVYVTGRTVSSTFPTTIGAYDSSFNGYYDIFVSKMDYELTELISSTYIGGSSSSSDDGASAIEVLENGNVVIACETSSSTFPSTASVFDTTYNGGSSDVVMVVMDSSLTSIVASSFIGGSAGDTVKDLKVGADGNIFITGYTSKSTTNFPTTAGAYRTVPSATTNAYITKMKSDLTELVYSTLYGNSTLSATFQGYDIAEDKNGDILLIGMCYANSLPVSANGYDPTSSGTGDYDNFVTRLNGTLSSVKVSTFIGGNGMDYNGDIAIARDGRIVIGSHTKSTNLPTDSNSFKTANSGGYDGYVAVLSSDLSELDASTYIGGAGTDYINDILTNDEGNIYVVGSTYSSTFTLTSDAFDSLMQGYEGYIMEFDKNLNAPIYSTFIGGNGSDGATAVTTDQNKNLFVAGSSSSITFPVTVGAYQTVNSGNNLSYIFKMPKTLTGLKAANYVKLFEKDGEIDQAVGNYTFSRLLMKISGLTEVGFGIRYNSFYGESTYMGKGFRFNYDIGLTEYDSGYVEIDFGDELHRFFIDPSGAYIPDTLYNPYESLEKDAAGQFIYTDRQKNSMVFSATGLLLSCRTKNGQAMAVEYDASDRPTALRDPASNRALTLEYNADGLIEKVKDPLNREVQFIYDTAGRLSQITDAALNDWYFSYDSAGFMNNMKDDQLRSVIDVIYDAEGRVTYVKDITSVKTEYDTAYDQDNNGNVTTQFEDMEGNVYTSVNNSLHEQQSQTNPLNHAAFYAYDEFSNIVGSVMPNGLTTSYSYDADGNMIQSSDQNGHDYAFGYDGNRNLLSVQNPNLVAEFYTYDESNNILTYEDAMENLYIYTYDNNGSMTSVTAPEGQVSTMAYENGQIKSITYPSGDQKTFGYDAAGRLTSVMDADQNTTTYLYDNNDRVIKVTDTNGDYLEMTYDVNGNILTQRDKKGNVTTYSYIDNQLVEITDALDNVTSYTYNSLGQVGSSTDARGNVTRFVYDALGRLITQTDDNDQSVHFEYDSMGNLISTTDTQDNTLFTRTYDSYSNLVEEIDALNHARTYDYDLLNRLTGSTDALDNESAYEYNDLNLLVQVTDPIGGISTKAYDGNRNVTDLTDQSGNTTSFGYDAYGRMASIQLATGYARQYLYNEKDQISQYINANEETTAYTYDSLNRLSTMTDTLGTTEIGYDKNSNVIQLEDLNSQIVKTYDALDRLTQVTDTDGNTVSYTYDEVGNLTTITYPDDSVVTYAYDNLNRLASVTDFNNKVTTYTYDSDSRMIRMDRGDDSYETYTYDLKNQLQTVIDRTEQGVLISDTAYTYDAAGDIVKEEEFVSDIRKENSYLDNHSLIGQSVYENDELVKQYAYSYDEAGNILNVQNGRFENTTDDVLEWMTDGDSFTYTTGNVIDTFNGESIAYDPEGNLTDAVIRGNAETFTYDQRNNLLQAFGIQYRYDLENDRVGKIEGESETRYVVDKNSALSRVLVRNTDGTLTKYVYGIGLLAEYTEGAGLYYHCDYRGSTIALTNDTGAVVDRYSYDPYGAVTEHEGSNSVDYLYCGKHSVSSEGNGLYFMHSRYYSTDLKRFLTEDKYAGKYSDITSLNQFAYVNGNPVTNVDPMGLMAMSSVEGSGDITLSDVITNNPDSYPYNLNVSGYSLAQQYYLVWYYGTEAYGRLDKEVMSHSSYLIYELDSMLRDGEDLSGLEVSEMDKMAFDNASTWMKIDSTVLAGYVLYSSGMISKETVSTAKEPLKINLQLFSKNPDIKLVEQNFLKRNGIDAHALKQSALGKKLRLRNMTFMLKKAQKN